MRRMQLMLIASVIFMLYTAPIWLLAADSSPAQFEDASENITSYPAPDTPWYAVGGMPVFVIGVPLAVFVAVVGWVSRRYGVPKP